MTEARVIREGLPLLGYLEKKKSRSVVERLLRIVFHYLEALGPLPHRPDLW